MLKSLSMSYFTNSINRHRERVRLKDMWAEASIDISGLGEKIYFAELKPTNNSTKLRCILKTGPTTLPQLHIPTNPNESIDKLRSILNEDSSRIIEGGLGELYVNDWLAHNNMELLNLPWDESGHGHADKVLEQLSINIGMTRNMRTRRVALSFAVSDSIVISHPDKYDYEAKDKERGSSVNAILAFNEALIKGDLPFTLIPVSRSIVEGKIREGLGVGFEAFFPGQLGKK